MSAIDGEWLEQLKDQFSMPYYKDLYNFVVDEYTHNTVYPPSEEIFNAFHYTPFEKVKCVILGQDPYHEPGQAHGLCFSVRPGVPAPPSLQNIYKELRDDLSCKIPNNGYLEKWAREGVLLLNTCLTVRAHIANSHNGHGWEIFTDAVIKAVDKKPEPVVFMLWGSYAGKKSELLTNKSHLVLKAPHPSPLSVYRGFFGCRHFSMANKYLEEHGAEPIDWQIDDIR